MKEAKSQSQTRTQDQKSKTNPLSELPGLPPRTPSFLPCPHTLQPPHFNHHTNLCNLPFPHSYTLLETSPFPCFPTITCLFYNRHKRHNIKSNQKTNYIQMFSAIDLTMYILISTQMSKLTHFQPLPRQKITNHISKNNNISKNIQLMSK